MSGGLKIANPSDNVAYWSIATIMRSDVAAMEAASAALDLGAAVVGTATSAVSGTLAILNRMKADIVTASAPGTDPTQVQTDISAQQASLKGVIASASFNGVNLLDGSQTAGTVGFVSGFTRTTTGTTVDTVGLNTGSTDLIGSANGVLDGHLGTAGNTDIFTFTLGSTTTSAQLATYAADIDAAIKQVTTVGARVGQAQTAMSDQGVYLKALTDAVTAGIGSLVDADMNVASTRLQALETQEKLGIQILAIANAQGSAILKLFGLG